VPAGRLSKGLHLKDIFVSAAGRSQGIGRVLLDHVAALARECGCTRVNWTTAASNTGAQKLYDAIGARREAKINYVVEGTLLAEMAARARR
jgi:ribosomal protein S18 acetylase RimI-like enzyme